MATNLSQPTKKRILQVCVKLFLEKGYKETTIAEIIGKSGVSISSFQHFFRAKDGVLTELVQFMFSEQFGAARNITGKLPPVCVYATETAIQLTVTEMNENLREIYVEAYSQREASAYIFQETAKELRRIFGAYLPELDESGFYALEIGSAGMMRGYMARPCDDGLTLERKIHSFLSLSLRAYNVPKNEIAQVLSFVEGLDIRATARQFMQVLFRALAIRFDFSAQELIQGIEA